MDAPPDCGILSAVVDPRHSSRVAALQLLYQLDSSHPQALAEQLDVLLERHFACFDEEASVEVREGAGELCRGVVTQRTEIDRLLDSAAAHWRVERMSRVDRNVLRLACYELTSRREIPPAVVLDEAIELAKEFGTDESRAFVNGVLSRVMQLLGLPSR